MTRLKYWSWPPFALGFLLLLPTFYLEVSAPYDHPFALPKPGNTSEVDVINGGYRAVLGDHEFELFYEVGVPPYNSVGLPQRPPVRCRFQLVEGQSGKMIAEIGQLHHAYDDPADNKAGFASETFELPRGKTRVKLTNIGCHEGSSVAAGVGGIYQFRDESLVPIGASILEFIGLASIALGFVIGLVRYSSAMMRKRRFRQTLS